MPLDYPVDYVMIESKDNIKSNIFFTKDGLDGIPITRFLGLSQHEEILHFITTRHGGYSEKPFHSFNLASHVGDREEHVLKNRDRLAKSLGISTKSFIFTQQEHGTNVFLINNRKGLQNNKDLTNPVQISDAMITAYRNICLLIFVADCVPVILFDYRKKVIALVHAGWKGTVGLITQKTIRLMQSHYHCRALDIICAIGPSIGPCCYQVGKDVLYKVKESFPKEQNLIRSFSNGERFFFDLWQANKIQLLSCGIPEEHIEIAYLCTSCHSNLFFSNRKEHQCTGRFAVGIMLRE
jgi:hypothetical protein